MQAGEAAQEVTRLVELALRDSHAVDTEALCVIAGRKVLLPPGFVLFALDVCPISTLFLDDVRWTIFWTKVMSEATEHG